MGCFICSPLDERASDVTQIVPMPAVAPRTQSPYAYQCRRREHVSYPPSNPLLPLFNFSGPSSISMKMAKHAMQIHTIEPLITVMVICAHSGRACIQGGLAIIIAMLTMPTNAHIASTTYSSVMSLPFQRTNILRFLTVLDTGEFLAALQTG